MVRRIKIEVEGAPDDTCTVAFTDPVDDRAHSLSDAAHEIAKELDIRRNRRYSTREAQILLGILEAYQQGYKT